MLSAIRRCVLSVRFCFFLKVTFLILLTRYSIPDYGDGYEYPIHSIVIAVLIGMSPIVIMIGIAVKEIIHSKGNIKKVKVS